jgi:hypothetical protein
MFSPIHRGPRCVAARLSPIRNLHGSSPVSLRSAHGMLRGGGVLKKAEPRTAIVGRDGASLFVNAGEASPLPNPKRDPEMRWNAYCYRPDPDARAAEFPSAARHSASRSRTQRMACEASRSPTLTVTFSSSGARERWRSRRRHLLTPLDRLLGCPKRTSPPSRSTPSTVLV